MSRASRTALPGGIVYNGSPVMVTRLAASFLVLVVFATSGAIGSIGYLCSMGGQVRSECCCKKNQAEADDDDHCDPPMVQAVDCCEVRVTKADRQQLARVETTQDQIQSLPVVAALPIITPVRPPALEEAGLPSGARGPPPGRSAPLFIWNCSYLI